MTTLRDLCRSTDLGSSVFRTAGLVVLTFATLHIVTYIIVAIRNIHFHPLSHVPGPKLWIALPILKFFLAILGIQDKDTRYYHVVHGPTIRVGVNELSFTSPEAWDEIQGSKVTPEMPRGSGLPAAPANDIIRADSFHHNRFRKALSHGFSDRALRRQENLIQSYVDLLILKLHNQAEQNIPVDLTLWFNFFTFDLIGDLAYGQSFNCLKSGVMHFYIANLLKSVTIRPIFAEAAEFPILAFLMKHILLSDKFKRVRQEQQNFAIKTITRRLSNGSKKDRADFVDAMSRNKGTELEINEDELISNALIILAAGSETTATLLTGVIYFLLSIPRVLSRVTEEVRAVFQRENDIIIASASTKLTYTIACIQETFRLYPPVQSSNQRRTVLPFTTIAGVAVSRGTKVDVHHSAAYRSGHNFTRPLEYIPERWLKENQVSGAEFADDKRVVLQPFGVGPRNCIGQNLAWAEVRLVLSKMLWTFDLQARNSMALEG